MPFDYSFKNGVAVVVPDDSFSADSAIDFMDKLYSDTPAMHVVWDFRAASLSGFPAHDFRRVAGHGATFADVRGPGAKTAFIVANDFERMLMQAFRDTSSSITPIEFDVFLTMEAARDWLAS